MKNQLKRLAAPNTWPIKRKGRERWIAKPNPGAHKQNHCMPIIVVLRDILKLATTKKEAKRVIRLNELLVNNRKVKDLRQGIGLFDVLTVPRLNKHYRVVLTEKNKLNLKEVSKAEANVLPLKVKSKTTIRKGKLQMNFTNGWNLLSKSHGINNTVLFDLAKSKVEKELKLKKGALVVLTGGRHVGKLAVLEEIKDEGLLKKKKLAMLKPKSGGSVFSTAARYLFAVGDAKSEFTATW